MTALRQLGPRPGRLPLDASYSSGVVVKPASGGAASAAARRYNTDTFAPDRISSRAWDASFVVASTASPVATYACVDTWLTDFRDDLPKIDVPVLAIHGTADRILPYDATAKRLPGLIKDLRLVTVAGGPHNIGWTHHDEVNNALLEFLAV
jgi:non-heme chloroperoxidase